MFRSISTVVAGSILAALMFAPGAARATTMVQFDDEDLSHIADAIVIADVVSSETEVQTLMSRGKQISTKTTLQVVDSWKGPYSAGETVTVRELGGRTKDEMAIVEGTAGFLTGERVLVFLSYRAATNEYGLVGWTQGKFTLLSNGRGGWDVAKVRIAVEKWGSAFAAGNYENRSLRGRDLSDFAVKVKRVVAADAASKADWRTMPKYRGLAGGAK